MPLSSGILAGAAISTNWRYPSNALVVSEDAAVYSGVDGDYLQLSQFATSPFVVAGFDGFRFDIIAGGGCALAVNRALEVQPIYNGSPIGVAKSVTVDQNSYTTKTAGGAGDLWSTGLTLDQVKSSSFGCRIRRTGSDVAEIRIRYVQLLLSYATPT